MPGLLADIRDSNSIQPNRCFTIRGDVKYIEKETDHTKVILSVFSYYNQEKPDEIVIYFKGSPKKIADKAIRYNYNILVIGDIVINNDIIFFNGKIIEVFRTMRYATDISTKSVDPRDINYKSAY